MSREIKFRAWNEDTRRMNRITQWNLAAGELIPATNQTALMQHTGLKDKHGTEIYEGDIVKKDATGTNGVVLWFAPTYAGHIIFHPKRGFIPDDWDGTYSTLDGRHGAFGDTHKLQVVGNVYESPALLESTS